VSREAIAAAFTAACREELEAPKPGNVHVFASSRKGVDLFVRSAEVAAGPLTAPRERTGARILGAVEATLAAVGTNTNLGIILLCAPLAAAAESGRADLRAALRDVLDALDIEDARLAFTAISRAAPGGLGHVTHHDVRAPATVTLRHAMAEASGRDQIARQYVTAFDAVFSLGLDCLAAAQQRWRSTPSSPLWVFLSFLAAFEDTHVVREHGHALASEIRRHAASLGERLRHADDWRDVLPELLAWDQSLKQRAINPGTSADLTVATLFVRGLQNILPFVDNND
jgi:triphosphoribosyl-dephospho-CoA synthase